MLLSVAYISRPLLAFTDEELVDLWESATESNKQCGITAGLYYDDRVFFQVLEGEADAVEALMARIKRDPRHTDVALLAENDIASPSFRFWPVKFVDGRRSPKLQARFDPEALAASSLQDINSNAFMLAMA